MSVQIQQLAWKNLAERSHVSFVLIANIADHIVNRGQLPNTRHGSLKL